MVEFWLSKDGEKLRLPVNPPSIDMSRGYQHTEVKVIALGDISFPQGAGLMKFSLESFFPAAYNPAYCEYSDIPAPWDCIDLLDAWGMSGEPVRFTVTGTPINTLVTIRDIKPDPWRHSDGDVGYSLSLVEYRNVNTHRTTSEGFENSGSGDVDGETALVSVGKGKKLTVYKTASTKAKKAGMLNDGAVVTIESTVGNWHKITTDKVSGYAQSKYILLTLKYAVTSMHATTSATRPVEILVKGATR